MEDLGTGHGCGQRCWRRIFHVIGQTYLDDIVNVARGYETQRDHLVRKSLSRKCKVLFLPSGNDPLFQVEPSPDGAQQDRDQYRDESVELARFDKLSDQEGHAK